MTRIRARQGHSIQVDVEPAEVIPPDMLFHHLLSTCSLNVGGHDMVIVVLANDTKRIQKDGTEFFLSRNDVWLIDFTLPNT